VTSAFLVRPREGDDDAIAAPFDAIQAVVPVAELATPLDAGLENLTGLVGTASGGRRPPEAQQRTASAPLQLWMDQRDERLDVAGRERLIRGSDGLDAHTPTVLRRTQTGKWDGTDKAGGRVELLVAQRGVAPAAHRSR
jgi:hypothetical protein